MKNLTLKHSLLILFLTSFSTLSAQRGLVYKQANTIDILVGGDFGWRFIDGDESDPTVAEAINNRKQFEEFRLSYRFGINYYHGIGERLSLKTGIRFANPGFSISSVEPIDPEQNINSIFKTYQYEGPEYRYKYQMIVVPLGLKYTIGGSFCNPYFELGISSNFYWRTSVEERIFESNKLVDQNTFIIEEPINRTNFIAFIGTGGDFVIANNIHGFTQLMARYQLNNLRSDKVIVERMVSLGMEVGVRYIFRN